ncbi:MULTISPECIES: response regulator transcription factor [unclassified Campylobacter]|uniref:response regulator transcription factor n=1 Tax=unclassified Campylobacter TaxID=2593542 RepID=UPI0022E9F43B|nr:MULTISPECIES: response regulator transcription factor [unclassified Campylobacter]MDA3042958.1 response regulator transcription factor [Campylobacter sp. JMF_09 ED2]MDA3044207.1 response regulator transcription factor [Campylobacter sp. JMF_07 ED4]MDA3049364.1 response regulator transcription factor [Campylobacter sp. JMF_15 NE4]MDA3051208.1 response regulator transcription factor [Campylobacter sp. JMF_02 ED1]MDA3056983.1 response regulator transcription factor [Campylobacter sp. VBCF_04 N
MTKILMIEDDLELAEILSEYLEQYEIDITVADDPFIGLSKLKLENFNLVILDLTLPGMDGLEVCKEIRKTSNLPIIISSARHDLTDKINAFDFGADDYLPKPYNPQELLARIKRHVERYNTGSIKQAGEKTNKDIVVDDFSHIITFKGQPLSLTVAEYDVLSYLVKKEGGAITREELIYNSSSISEESSPKSIDVIVGRIRVKLGETSKTPQYIHAIRGVGYKLVQ